MEFYSQKKDCIESYYKFLELWTILYDWREMITMNLIIIAMIGEKSPQCLYF
jgi:hypothetical protein